MFTYFFVPLETCSPSPYFKLHLFPETSITAGVGITSEEVKNRLRELPRVSFLQMINNCLIFFDTNCELASVTVWFHPYVELLPQLWSPYFLLNMMTFDMRFKFKACG